MAKDKKGPQGDKPDDGAPAADAGGEQPASAAAEAAAPEGEAKSREAKSGEGKPAKAKGQQKGGGDKGKGGGKDKKDAKKPEGPAPTYKRDKPPRLMQLYRDDVKARLQKEFSYTNVMQVPRLVKITINMGLGAAVQNPKIMESAVEELRLIAGQAPVVTKAKRDIANFKLRTGLKIGAMVTLRRERMWEFLDRFINIALPRVRDFKGVSQKAFDGRGNYSVGVREQIIFPEIEYDNIDSIKGLNITIVTTARTDEEGRALLRHLGMPFRQAAAAAANEQGARA
jgi:large subunit ribosomal protein L5